jgi:hypothetical protein
MSDDQPLTQEDLLRIASEVWEGKRPENDLERYGISLGPEVSGDEAKQQLLDELAALGKDGDEGARQLFAALGGFDEEEE